MTIYKVGDTIQANCMVCKSTETIIFELRDSTFSDDSEPIKNILLGICTKCDKLAMIPPQVSIAIKKHLEDNKI